MRLLYISTFLFHQDNCKTYGLPANSDSFFQKYLDVFDSVHVLGDAMYSYLDINSLTEMVDKRISVRLLPSNTHPLDFKNDKHVRLILEDEISKAEAIIIKPATRKGIMAIKIAKAYGKPYMIEMTGDIHNALRQHPNMLKRLYAPILYRQIKNAIKDAPFGLYVSQKYLQSQFPIKGEMCGCSDVVLDFSDTEVLNRRFKLIDSIDTGRQINLALIGFYQGRMKGVDTAIRALSKLPNSYHLNILGNGTEENRNRWYKYAIKHGISKPRERMSFPQPLKSSEAVLNWLDTQDFFVLPTLSEGLPRSVVEAISRGCICFASNLCSLPELLQKDCLFEKKDEMELANLILFFSSNKSLMLQNAKTNYEHAKEYMPNILKAQRNEFLNRFKAFAACQYHGEI